MATENSTSKKKRKPFALTPDERLDIEALHRLQRQLRNLFGEHADEEACIYIKANEMDMTDEEGTIIAYNANEIAAHLNT